MPKYADCLLDTHLTVGSVFDFSNSSIPQPINDHGHIAQLFNLEDKEAVSKLSEKLEIENIEMFNQDIENITDYTNNAFLICTEDQLPLYLWTELPSKNYKQTKTQKTDALVLHYTACNLETTLTVFLRQTDVSVHYVVSKSGIIMELIPEDKVAWHAGKSCWQKKESLNQYSIGIETINQGYETDDGHWEPFTEAQKKSVCLLSKDIVERHNLSPDKIIGHQDIAPNRKVDPGPLFFWDEMAKYGVGFNIKNLKEDTSNHEVICKINDQSEDVKIMQEKLSKFGYDVESNGIYDENTSNVVNAFNTHFLQKERIELENQSKRTAKSPWTTLCNITIDKLLELQNIETA